MAIALYTPATVGLIRSVASRMLDLEIARDLGWPLDRLQRIARKHDIALRSAVRVCKPKRPAIVPTAAIKVDASLPIKVTGDWAWLGREKVHLSKNDIPLLECLRASSSKLEPDAVASRLGWNKIKLSQQINQLRIKLNTIGLTISSARADGGYQLLLLMP